MRAIIIDDKDAKDLICRLELEKFKRRKNDPDEWPIIEEMHRWFHYQVVRWLQEQGASMP